MNVVFVCPSLAPKLTLIIVFVLVLFRPVHSLQHNRSGRVLHLGAAERSWVRRVFREGLGCVPRGEGQNQVACQCELNIAVRTTDKERWIVYKPLPSSFFFAHSNSSNSYLGE